MPLAVLFCISSASAQSILEYKEYYIGTGYNVSYAPFGKLNSILDEFNNQTVQEKEFGALRVPNGFSVELGTHLSIFSISGGFTSERQNKKTLFAINDELRQRNADLHMTAYHLGAGIFTPVSDRFGLGINVAAELNNFKLRTREGVEGQLKNATYVSPIIERLYGLTGELKLYAGLVDEEGTKLMIKPYFTYIPKKLDLTPFHQAINPDVSTDGMDLQQEFSHFGVKIIITYSVVR
jgi:hypothetical protein